MKEFLITIFFERKIIRKKLSNILAMCSDGKLPSSLFECGISLEFPFYFIDDYCMAEVSNERMEISIENKFYKKFRVVSGSCVNVKVNKEEKSYSYSVLFIDTSAVNLEYKKYKINSNSIFIGRAEENTLCYKLNNNISRKHAAIRVDENGYGYIEDLSRKTGVYLNGNLVTSSKLELFDEIYILGLSIIFMGKYIAVNDFNITCSLPEYKEFKAKNIKRVSEDVNYFIRSPRIMKSLESGEFEIDPPTTKQTSKKTPIILTVGPSITMSIAMLVSLAVSISNAMLGGSMTSVVTSGAMAVSMLMGAVVWPLALNSYRKKQEKREEAYRIKKYTAYIEDKSLELNGKYEKNVRVWNEALAPSADDLVNYVNDKNKRIRLWERGYEDKDFLSVRIGTGKRPLGIDIKIPKEGFSLDDDDLKKRPREIADKYKTLEKVPITISLLEQKTIGIVGDKGNILNLAREICLNIVALHSFDEVKTVFIYNEKEEEEFKWIKEIPHTWSNDRSMRYVASNTAEVHQIFVEIDEILKERNERTVNIPHFVFFITDISLIENESLKRYIESSKNVVGVSSLYITGSIYKLPKECSAIIESSESRTGYYIKNKNNNKYIEFNKDNISIKAINEFGEELANLPVKADSRTLAVPNKITFMQMYQSGNVKEINIEKRWKNNNSNKSLAVPIGVSSGGRVFSLDIHESYHGCHGLVAGMTGSGKSEFLQEYILSLLVNYGPNEVSFVLVDFKGGDMARPFMSKYNPIEKRVVPAVPHLAATISNLSGNILYRALISFEAEIKRRQKSFNEAAALLEIDKIDINSYQKYFKEGKLKTPLPHLIIIVDEFAQLKTQQPEFLAQLINIAQVGRSLGIHLILATQKPNGVVDPQIWSNSRFRVCLKVLDKQDSSEMIGRADAAMIKLPGRAYVQVGYDEVFETIQSAYSGAEYIAAEKYILDEDITVSMIDNTATVIRSMKDDSVIKQARAKSINSKEKVKTQLEAVVSEVISVGIKNNLKVRPLWCDLLKQRVYLEELEEDVYEENTLRANVGMVDFIRSQEQGPLTIDFMNNGHIVIYGTSGSGKTTFIQTLLFSLAVKYNQEEFNTYILDLGGRTLNYFNTIPQCKAVAFDDNEDGILDVINRIQEIIDERKGLFASKNCGSYEEYLISTKKKLPAIVLVIDNYSPFREKYFNMEDSILSIISIGKAYGVFAVITGNSKNGVYYKILEHVKSVYSLRMNDSSNYREILNMPIHIEPENVKGRGITVIDGEVVEFQTALTFESDNEAERVDKIVGILEGLSDGNELNNSSEKGISKIQQEVKGITKKEIVKKSYTAKKTNIPMPIERSEYNLVLGKSISGSIDYGVKFESFKSLFIGGINIHKIETYGYKIINELTKFNNSKIVIIDGENDALKHKVEGLANVSYINSSQDFDKFLEGFKVDVRVRRGKYKQLKEAELDDEIIFGNMCCFERIFIFINKFSGFYDFISDDCADMITAIAKLSDGLGIYFITTDNLNDLSQYTSVELYKYLIKTTDGIICDGYLSSEYSGMLCDDAVNYVNKTVAKSGDSYLFYTDGKIVNIK